MLNQLARNINLNYIVVMNLKVSFVSELRVIEFYRWWSLHHVLKCSNFRHILSATWAKVTNSRRYILWMRLFTDRGSGIISLILVYLFHIMVWSPCLWKSPTWKISFGWGISRSFWDISAWSNWAWSRGLIFECTSTASSEAESI